MGTRGNPRRCGARLPLVPARCGAEPLARSAGRGPASPGHGSPREGGLPRGRGPESFPVPGEGGPASVAGAADVSGGRRRRPSADGGADDHGGHEWFRSAAWNELRGVRLYRPGLSPVPGHGSAEVRPGGGPRDLLHRRFGTEVRGRRNVDSAGRHFSEGTHPLRQGRRGQSSRTRRGPCRDSGCRDGSTYRV